VVLSAVGDTLVVPDTHNNTKQAMMLTTVSTATYIDQKLLVKSLMILTFCCSISIYSLAMVWITEQLNRP
jgi:phage gp36-like protein